MVKIILKKRALIIQLLCYWNKELHWILEDGNLPIPIAIAQKRAIKTYLVILDFHFASLKC